MKKFYLIVFFILWDCSNNTAKISKTKSFNKLSMNRADSKNLITAATKETITSTLSVLTSSKNLAHGGKIADASGDSIASILDASGSEPANKNQDISILDSLDIVALIDAEDGLEKPFDPYFPKFVVKIGDNSSYNLTDNPIHIKVFDDNLCESNNLAEFNFSSNNKIATFQPKYSIIPARAKYEFSLLSGASCLPITFLWPDNFVVTEPKNIVIVSPSDRQLIGYNDKISILCDKKNNSVKISSESFLGKEFDFACVETGTFQFNYPWKDSLDKSTLLNIKIFNDTKSQISETNLSVGVDFTNPKATIVPLAEAQYISDFPLSYKILFSKPIALSSFDITDDIGINSIDGCLAENILVSSKKSSIAGYVDEIVFQIKNLSNDCVFHPIIKENSIVDAYGNYLLKMAIEPDDKTFIKNAPESPIVKILDPIVASSTQSNPVISAYYDSSATFKNYRKMTLHFTSDCSDLDKGQISSSVIYPAKNVLFSVKSPLVTDGSYSFFIRIVDPLGRVTCSDQVVGYNFYTLDPNDLSLKNADTSSYPIDELGVYQTNNALISFDMKIKNDFKNYNSISIFASQNSVLGSDESPVAKICLDKDACIVDSSLLSGTFKDASTLSFSLNLEKYDQFENVPLYFFAKGINLDGETVVSLPENPLNIDTIIPDSNFSVVFSNGQNYLRSNSLFQKIRINSLTSKNFKLGSNIKFLLESCDETSGKIWLETSLISRDLIALSSNNYLDFSIAPSSFLDEFKNRDIKVFTKITDLLGNTVCESSNYITFHFDDIPPSEPSLSVNGVTTLYTKESSISFDVKTKNSDQKFNTSDLIQFYTVADCNDSSSVSDWLNMPNISADSKSVTLDLNFAADGSYNLFVRTKDSVENVSNCSTIPFNLIIKKTAEPLPVIALKSYDSYSVFDATGLSYPNKISISASPASGHTFQVGDSYAFLKSCDTPFPSAESVGVFIASDATMLVKSGLAASLNDTFVFVIKDKAGNISCSNVLSIVSAGLSNFALDESVSSGNDFSSLSSLGGISSYTGTKLSLSLILKPSAGESFGAGSAYFIGNSCAESWPLTSDARLQTVDIASTAALPINITANVANNYKLVDYFVIMKNSSGVQSCKKILSYAYKYDVTAPIVTAVTSAAGIAGKSSSLTLTGAIAESVSGILSLTAYRDSICSNAIGGAASITGAVSPYSFSYPISALAEDQYIFYFKVVDNAGNSSCSGSYSPVLSYSYTYSKTPPTISFLPATSATSSTATSATYTNITPQVTITASPKVPGTLDSLELYSDSLCSSTKIASSALPNSAYSYALSQPLFGITSTFYAKAVDIAGNSTCSSEYTLNLIDTIAPVVNLVTNDISVISISRQVPINLPIIESGSGVKTVNAYYDAGCTKSVSAGTLGAYSPSSSVYSYLSGVLIYPAKFTLYFQATDYSGKISNCSSGFYNYEYDNAAPSSFTFPPSQFSSSPSVAINFVADDVYGGSGISSVALYKNNCTTLAPGILTNTSGTNWNYIETLTTPGTNSYYIIAKDKALNISVCTLGFIYTYDNTLPVITPLGSSTGGSIVPIAITGSALSGRTVSAISVYSDDNCSNAISGGTFSTPSLAASVTYTYSPVNLVEGANHFYFQIKDSANNLSKCSSSLPSTGNHYVFNLVTGKPLIKFAIPASAGSSTIVGPTISFTTYPTALGTGNIKVYENSPFCSGASSVTIPINATGSYTYTATAPTDALIAQGVISYAFSVTDTNGNSSCKIYTYLTKAPFDLATTIGSACSISADNYINLTGNSMFWWTTKVCARNVLINGSDLTIDSGGGNVLNYQGAIAGNGSLRIISSSGLNAISFADPSLTLSTPNTFTGSITLQVGSLVLNKASGVTAIPSDFIMNTTSYAFLKWRANNQVADDVSMTINSVNGIVDLNGMTEYFLSLKMVAGSTVALGTGGSLTVNQFWYDKIRCTAGTYTSSGFTPLSGSGSSTCSPLVTGSGDFKVNN